MNGAWQHLLEIAVILTAALFLLAGCDDLGGTLAKTSRTITDKGTPFDVTYWLGKESTEIAAGGKTVSASFDATFIDIRRANGVAMKADERERALDIATAFCQINRVPLAPAPGRAKFDGEGWRLTNHCGKFFR